LGVGFLVGRMKRNLVFIIGVGLLIVIVSWGVGGQKFESGAWLTPTPGVAEAKQSGGSRGTVRTSQEVMLLARVIEGEASGEPLAGKIAVGAVILNRVRNAAFPKTLAAVVYQPSAFESVRNGQINRPVSKESVNAAWQAMAGADPTGGATFFWNPAKKVSAWIWSRPIVARIGAHVFAR